MATHRHSKDSEAGNLGGMMKSLGGFLGFLSELAEKGEELSRTGEISTGDGDDKKGMKAVYGFSVRLGGAGGAGPRVEPFGNVKVGSKGTAVVEEAREPMVDTFDEDSHVVVVAELPGVDAKDIHYTVEGDVLELRATRGERKYRKEVLLPQMVDATGAESSFRNGVFELRFPKAKP